MNSSCPESEVSSTHPDSQTMVKSLPCVSTTDHSQPDLTSTAHLKFCPQRKLSSDQQSVFDQLTHQVQEKCQTDPDWAAQRAWLLGNASDCNRERPLGMVYEFVSRHRATKVSAILNKIIKGVNRRQLEAASRVETISPQTRDPCAIERLTSTSEPMTPSESTADQPISSSFTLSPTQRPISSSSGAQLSTPSSSDQPTAPHDSATFKPNSITNQGAAVQPQALVLGNALDSNLTLAPFASAFSNCLFVWASNPSNGPSLVRKAVTTWDIFELPPVINDALVLRYLFSRYLRHLILMAKLRRIPTPDSLLQHCNALSGVLDQDWGSIKAHAMTARTQYNTCKKTQNPSGFNNIRSHVLPFYDLADSQRAAEELDQQAMSMAREFFEDPLAKSKLLTLKFDMKSGLEPWAQAFCSTRLHPQASHSVTDTPTSAIPPPLPITAPDPGPGIITDPLPTTLEPDPAPGSTSDPLPMTIDPDPTPGSTSDPLPMTIDPDPTPGSTSDPLPTTIEPDPAPGSTSAPLPVTNNADQLSTKTSMTPASHLVQSASPTGPTTSNCEATVPKPVPTSTPNCQAATSTTVTPTDKAVIESSVTARASSSSIVCANATNPLTPLQQQTGLPQHISITPVAESEGQLTENNPSTALQHPAISTSSADHGVASQPSQSNVPMEPRVSPSQLQPTAKHITASDVSGGGTSEFASMLDKLSSFVSPPTALRTHDPYPSGGSNDSMAPDLSQLSDTSHIPIKTPVQVVARNPLPLSYTDPTGPISTWGNTGYIPSTQSIPMSWAPDLSAQTARPSHVDQITQASSSAWTVTSSAAPLDPTSHILTGHFYPNQSSSGVTFGQSGFHMTSTPVRHPSFSHPQQISQVSHTPSTPQPGSSFRSTPQHHSSGVNVSAQAGSPSLHFNSSPQLQGGTPSPRFAQFSPRQQNHNISTPQAQPHEGQFLQQVSQRIQSTNLNPNRSQTGPSQPLSAQHGSFRAPTYTVPHHNGQYNGYAYPSASQPQHSPAQIHQSQAIQQTLPSNQLFRYVAHGFQPTSEHQSPWSTDAPLLTLSNPYMQVSTPQGHYSPAPQAQQRGFQTFQQVQRPSQDTTQLPSLPPQYAYPSPSQPQHPPARIHQSPPMPQIPPSNQPFRYLTHGFQPTSEQQSPWSTDAPVTTPSSPYLPVTTSQGHHLPAVQAQQRGFQVFQQVQQPSQDTTQRTSLLPHTSSSRSSPPRSTPQTHLPQPSSTLPTRNTRGTTPGFDNLTYPQQQEILKQVFMTEMNSLKHEYIRYVGSINEHVRLSREKVQTPSQFQALGRRSQQRRVDLHEWYKKLHLKKRATLEKDLELLAARQTRMGSGSGVPRLIQIPPALPPAPAPSQVQTQLIVISDDEKEVEERLGSQVPSEISTRLESPLMMSARISSQKRRRSSHEITGEEQSFKRPDPNWGAVADLQIDWGCGSGGVAVGEGDEEEEARLEAALQALASFNEADEPPALGSTEAEGERPWSAVSDDRIQGSVLGLAKESDGGLPLGLTHKADQAFVGLTDVGEGLAAGSGKDCEWVVIGDKSEAAVRPGGTGDVPVLGGEVDELEVEGGYEAAAALVFSSDADEPALELEDDWHQPATRSRGEGDGGMLEPPDMLEPPEELSVVTKGSEKILVEASSPPAILAQEIGSIDLNQKRSDQTDQNQQHGFWEALKAMAKEQETMIEVLRNVRLRSQV